MKSNLYTRETGKNHPKVSFIIPTLNASKYLGECLKSITAQEYPSDKIEIFVADGGSVDSTKKIAIKYGAKILKNSRITSESGKAVGIKKATGEYIIFVDADNILPNPNWLTQMITPLVEDSTLIGSEPISFTYRKSDGYIDRYCALMGMNDPLCYWLGAYDRNNTITGKWTGLPVRSTVKQGYLEIRLESGNIPTIGANGTVFRRKIFIDKPDLFGDYYFDTDLLETLAKGTKILKFAKVNTGIIHKYCGSSLRTFIRKQLRRVSDYLSRRPIKDIVVVTNLKERKYNYGQKSSFDFVIKISTFSLECVLLIPLIIQAIRGFSKKPDVAWFAHPLLCWITLLVYARGAVESIFMKNKRELSRKNWTQE